MGLQDKSKRTALAKFNELVTAFENYSIAIGIIVISAIIFVNVIARYFFDTSFTWPEELSRYIIIAVTFIGLSSCARYDVHVSVDILSNKLNGYLANLHKILIYFICASVSLFLSYQSIRFTVLQYLGGNISVALPIPTWVLYLSVSIGFVLATYTYSLKLYQVFANRKNWNEKEVEKC